MRLGILVGCGMMVWAALAQSAAASDPVFSDQTAAAGINSLYSYVSGTPGAYHLAGGAAGDFNNDGYEDLFVLSGGNLGPDYLYINNGDGTFTDQAATWGVAVRHRGAAAAVGDYNNDGWLDIYVTSAGPVPGAIGPGNNKLYRNNGDGTFTDVAVAGGVNVTNPTSDGFVNSPAFGDYDLDGDLDLFVTAWWNDGTPNGGNRLFRNNGDGTFTDVTVAAGIDAFTPHGFSVTFADMNGDRWPELLLAADFYSSRYYINNGDGTFTDATANSGTGLDSNGMGHAVGDCNGDGLMDWYVTSIYDGSASSGNMLYQNAGSDVYNEVSLATGCKDAGWAWGAVMEDFNNDGAIDILSTQGYIVNEPHKTRLFINDGAGNFADMAVAAGLDYELMGRGVVTFDYDNDGDRDVVLMGTIGAPTKLFRNDTTGSDTHWVRIELDTSNAPHLAPRGVGSRVVVWAGGQRQVHLLHGGSNYLSQSELSLHVGLGTQTTIDRLRVEWADGTRTVLRNVAADRVLTVYPPTRLIRTKAVTTMIPPSP